MAAAADTPNIALFISSSFLFVATDHRRFLTGQPMMATSTPEPFPQLDAVRDTGIELDFPRGIRARRRINTERRTSTV